MREPVADKIAKIAELDKELSKYRIGHQEAYNLQSSNQALLSGTARIMQVAAPVSHITNYSSASSINSAIP